MKTSGDTFSSGFSLVLAFVTITLPYVSLGYLSRNFDRYKSDPTFKQHFETFVSEMNLGRRSSLLMTFLFMMRRQLFALSAVFFVDSPVLQVNLMLI